MSHPAKPMSPNLTREDLLHCAEVLEQIGADLSVLSSLSREERIRLLMAAGKAIKPDLQVVRRQVKANRRDAHAKRLENNKKARSAATIRLARGQSVYNPPSRRIAAPGETVSELETEDHCYVCKVRYTKVHHFYDSMCSQCGDFNYEKRFQTCSLVGRTALITGARVKIGYQAALMMLRAGARVIVTTRFPRDAAQRYTKEPDFGEWKDRLLVYGLDLRHSPSVETFAKFLEHSEDRLDFLINNAAQTVRRPPGFYAHLLEREELPFESFSPEEQRILGRYHEFRALLSGGGSSPVASEGVSWISEWHRAKGPAALGIVAATQLSQIPYACEEAPLANALLFPYGKLDADLQQVDLRTMNSWRMKLADVPTAELLEVQLVNSIAPYVLCAKLKPLMLRHPTGDKHVVNVSAMEGKFARHTKTDRHPHTNMAKAALNMMTLTSARDYAEHGIYMNAVDTGWVTDEDPAELAKRKVEELDFQPPLDIVDGAARVLDPIFSGLITGKHSWGNFLKDYQPTEW